MRYGILAGMGLGAKAASESNDVSEYFCREDERFGGVELLASDVPVIDLAADEDSIVKNVAAACRRWGFFQVINHGVSPPLIHAAFGAAKEFFDLPADRKSRSNAQGVSSDPGGGVVAYGINFPPKDARRTDNKATDFRDFLRIMCDEADLLDAWPKEPAKFETVMREFNKQTSMLEKRLLRIISAGLGLPGDCLSDCFGATHRNMQLLNYYPPYRIPEVVKGVSSHSDASGLTILLQDSIGGLEVRNEGRWFPVKPIANAFVVNVADQLEILTNGAYESPLHRVRVDCNKPRFSIVSFYGPSLDTMVAPIPQLVGDGAPKYREVLTREFLSRFYSRALVGKTALDSVRNVCGVQASV